MATRRLVVGVVVLMVAIGVFSGFALAQQERNITATLVDTNIEDALRLLFQDTPYSFSIVSGDSKGAVTLTLNNVPFLTALDAVLSPLNLTYTRQGDVFVIHKALSVDTTVPNGNGGGLPEVTQPTAKTFRLYQLNFADALQIARLFGGKGAGMTGSSVGTGQFNQFGAGFMPGIGTGYQGGYQGQGGYPGQGGYQGGTNYGTGTGTYNPGGFYAQ